MIDCLEDRVVAKKKPGPAPRPEGRGVNIRVNPILAGKLKYLALGAGKTVSSYLDEMIKDEVDARFRAAAPRDEKGK